MDNSTYVSLSLAQSMQNDLTITTNNIANANTAGFKGEHIVFESYLHNGGDTTDSEQISFVTDGGSYIDDRQGSLTQTGNALDVGLLGKGWFSYRTEDGRTAYGRDGQLTLSPEGNLITLNGAKLLDTGGSEITLTADTGDVAIARDGTISSETNGVIGQIGVFDLSDLQNMTRIGGGMLVRPEGAPAPAQAQATLTEVVQGAIERSNVEPISEMTRLMQIQRAYERAVNLMNGEDDLRRDTLQRLSRQA